MQEGVYLMQHRRLPFMVTPFRHQTLAASQTTAAPHLRYKKGKWRKIRKTSMRLASTSCLLLIFALMTVKLIAAGLPAILWGIGILNVSCVLGGLVSYWEDSDKTAAVKNKAPAGIPVPCLLRSDALAQTLPLQDSRYLAQYEVNPFASATEELPCAEGTMSASAV